MTGFRADNLIASELNQRYCSTDFFKQVSKRDENTYKAMSSKVDRRWSPATLPVLPSPNNNGQYQERATSPLFAD